MKKVKIITVCCSAAFYKQALDIEKQLKKLGFKVKIPYIAYIMKKNNNFDVSFYKTWHKDKKQYPKKTKLMDIHFKKVLQADAILVLNFEKDGIQGYIGGNGLLEMFLAYIHKKPVFIYNPIPDDLNIAEEVYGLNPIFINQDLGVISASLRGVRATK
ncbi:hypothetical protein A3B39_00170 [Candidatus Daviesbacteria bacterium RIFCSPLOWO2_01_FULL_37_10]|nr:MAG: hypothetical protein A3B39_00170 [Candidatus Daviesbacteria bacterium RIFCSPLOWO2_01_FULL_37_10]